MAAITWTFDRFVPIEPDRAYAWLTDYRSDDHARPAFRRGALATEKEAAKSKREIIARHDDGVTLRDTWKGRTWEVRVRHDKTARTITMEGKGGYRATWRVTENPGGARIHVEGALDVRGLTRILAPLFAKGMTQEMRRDFDGHMADIVSELNPEGVPVGGGIDAIA